MIVYKCIPMIKTDEEDERIIDNLFARHEQNAKTKPLNRRVTVKEIVSGWPQWKRDVKLTKYSKRDK